MKRNARLFSGLMAVGSLVLAGALLPASAASASATVKAIKAGGAQYTVDGTTWNTLQVGTVLSEGATVKTDAAGVVDLNLGANGPAVRLTPSTTLKIHTLSLTEGAGEKIATTELGLPEGKIHAVVRKLSASSKWEVKTSVSTCGVRGMRVTVTSRGEMVVLDGSGYAYYTAPGQTQPKRFDVGSGYMFDPALNNNQGGVIEILPSVKIELEEAASGLLQWAAVEARIQQWAPSPQWNVPKREGESTGKSGPADASWQTVDTITEPQGTVSPVE